MVGGSWQKKLPFPSLLVFSKLNHEREYAQPFRLSFFFMILEIGSLTLYRIKAFCSATRLVLFIILGNDTKPKDLNRSSFFFFFSTGPGCGKTTMLFGDVQPIFRRCGCRSKLLRNFELESCLSASRPNPREEPTGFF